MHTHFKSISIRATFQKFRDVVEQSVDRLSERISPQRKVLTATSVRRPVDGVDYFDFLGV